MTYAASRREYLAEEDWVAYTRSFSDSLPHTYHLNISAVDFLYERGVAGLSSFLIIWHILAFFQAYHVSESSSMKNQTLYLNHTFD